MAQLGYSFIFFISAHFMQFNLFCLSIGYSRWFGIGVPCLLLGYWVNIFGGAEDPEMLIV